LLFAFYRITASDLITHIATVVVTVAFVRDRLAFLLVRLTLYRTDG
jgi:hypothetical protein